MFLVYKFFKRAYKANARLEGLLKNHFMADDHLLLSFAGSVRNDVYV